VGERRTRREVAGASAWDGYVTTAIAEQVAAVVGTRRSVEITLPTRPALYVEEF